MYASNIILHFITFPFVLHISGATKTDWLLALMSSPKQMVYEDSKTGIVLSLCGSEDSLSSNILRHPVHIRVTWGSINFAVNVSMYTFENHACALIRVILTDQTVGEYTKQPSFLWPSLCAALIIPGGQTLGCACLDSAWTNVDWHSNLGSRNEIINIPEHQLTFNWIFGIYSKYMGCLNYSSWIGHSHSSA